MQPCSFVIAFDGYFNLIAFDGYFNLLWHSLYDVPWTMIFVHIQHFPI